jgi:hypothetical protein
MDCIALARFTHTRIHTRVPANGCGLGGQSFLFLFGAFRHGNDLWRRNLLAALSLRKIVSIPLGHPHSQAILMHTFSSLKCITHCLKKTCDTSLVSFLWESERSHSPLHAAFGPALRANPSISQDRDGGALAHRPLRYIMLLAASYWLGCLEPISRTCWRTCSRL